MGMTIDKYIKMYSFPLDHYYISPLVSIPFSSPKLHTPHFHFSIFIEYLFHSLTPSLLNQNSKEEKMAETIAQFPMLNIESKQDADKLITYEIFSILENNFLFGHNQAASKLLSPKNDNKNNVGKVRILSIDGRGSTDGILAAKSLAHFETYLRTKSNNPSARIADYFDVVTGSNAGGILAALLFTRGRDGNPLFTADEALNFIIKNRLKIFGASKPAGFIRRVFKPSSKKNKAEKLFSQTFGDLTVKDTLKSVLIPCYDLTSRAPFLFSRADAIEMDDYDFKMSDVCTATCADPSIVGPVEIRSVDKKSKILAVDGGIAMNNPTAAAITHVLNNKQEFPLCNGVEDLLVVSLGNGESEIMNENLTPSANLGFQQIACDGFSDLVDQAISMAFGESHSSNYIRIQSNNIMVQKQHCSLKEMNPKNKINILGMIEEMLVQKNVESILFKGKRIAESSNLEKLELFAAEVVKEKERRKTSILPMVTLKQNSTSPRTSSATTLSSWSSN